MRVALKYDLPCVMKFEGQNVPHIVNHEEFDKFLDALPVDIGLTKTEGERKLDEAMMKFKESSE